MKSTYTMLRDGSWGVRVEGAVKAGQAIVVTKKSGETKTEYVKAVLWTGDGVSLCSLANGSKTSFSPRRERMGPGRGSAARVPGYSSYCTDNASCRCYDCAS